MTQQARDNGNLGWHLRIKTTGQRSPFRVPFTRVGDMLEVV